MNIKIKINPNSASTLLKLLFDYFTCSCNHVHIHTFLLNVFTSDKYFSGFHKIDKRTEQLLPGKNDNKGSVIFDIATYYACLQLKP